MALTSMTGFGTGTASAGDERLEVEAKSVNGKFCEVRARLPRELASLETEIVRLVKDRLARGNVDVMVRRQSDRAATTVARVNEPALDSLVRALEKRQAGPVRLEPLLSLPGIVTLEEVPPDLEAARGAVTEALGSALVQLGEARRREGAALEKELASRIALVRARAKEVQALVPQSVAEHRDKLKARVEELSSGAPIDPGRLEQELVLFADRIDVTEELTRLFAHCDEFERLLGETGPVGRTLEFVLQELGREVNTTGSKSQSAAIARLVVDLKAELERLREQVQNVE